MTSQKYNVADDARINVETTMFMQQSIERYPKVPMCFAQEIGQRHAIEIVLLHNDIKILKEELKNVQP